jgi:hypothetical protein
MVRVRRCQACAASVQTGTGRGVTVYSGPGGEGRNDLRRGLLRKQRVAPAEAGSTFGVSGSEGDGGDGEG